MKIQYLPKYILVGIRSWRLREALPALQVRHKKGGKTGSARPYRITENPVYGKYVAKINYVSPYCFRRLAYLCNVLGGRGKSSEA